MVPAHQELRVYWRGRQIKKQGYPQGREGGGDAVLVRAGRRDLPGELSSSSSAPPASLRNSFVNPPPPHRPSPVCRWDPGSEGSGTFSGHNSPGSFWRVLSASGRVCVNRPESQQVLVSKWEPTCSFVEDASLGLRLPLSGSGCPHLPPCLWWEMSQCTAS